MVKGGEWYNPNVIELKKDRVKIRLLTEKYNESSVDNLEERERLLKSMFGSVGKNVYIGPTFKCDYGYNIKLGDNVFMNFDCSILDSCPVVIKKNSMLACNVHITT
eukprot:UN26074